MTDRVALVLIDEALGTLREVLTIPNCSRIEITQEPRKFGMIMRIELRIDSIELDTAAARDLAKALHYSLVRPR